MEENKFIASLESRGYELSNLIEFSIHPMLHGVAPEPYPTSTQLPKWFKSMHPRIDVSELPDIFPTGTVKLCNPFLDAISLGYIIPLANAVRCVIGEEVVFSWQDGTPKMVEPHGDEQIPNSPFPSPFFKWINVWKITTPPGYSTLFLPIINDVQPFECFAGLVDTDTYPNMVNFPFWWKQPNTDMLLDRGTPLVQAIPIKRETWHSNVRIMEKQELMEQEKSNMKTSGKLRGYKTYFRTKKRPLYR